MTTYEQGRAPEGAPVTWTLHEATWNWSLVGEAFDDFVDVLIKCDTHKVREVDAICKAFHVAKLAEEAAEMLGRAPLTPPGTTEWLGRYREATR